MSLSPAAHIAAVPGDPESAENAVTGRGDRAFRPDIQGLRAVAVLLVVLYHCAVPGVHGGYVGVDVFFVISGFLITRQLVTEHQRTGRISLPSFYARRIKRLLPAALAVVACTVIIARLAGPTLQVVTTAKDGIFSTFYAMNYRLAILGTDYQHAGGPVSPLQHLWSLAVEEQFYIGWPLAIVLVGRLSRRRVSAALGWVAAAVVVGSLAESVVVTGRDAPLAYFALQTRAWELGVGALIVVLTPILLRVPRAVSTVSGWCGLALTVFAALRFTDATPFPGTAAVVPVLGAALLIAAGLSPRPAGTELLLGRPGPQLLGRLSYGWYLWHWPVIVLGPALVGLAASWPVRLTAAAMALGLAALSYSYIERATGRRLLSPPRWFVAGAVMSTVVTVVCALVILLPQPPMTTGSAAAGLNLQKLDTAQLSRLLDRASSTSTVPADLSPSLADAVDDVPPTSADGCHADFLSVQQPPCVFGDVNGRRTVVLFGDSHAEQWFGAMDALARSKGWKLISWTKAACPLADVLLMNTQLQRPYQECPAWRKATEQRMAALHPDLVIASGADPLPGQGYSNSAWSSETTATLSALKDAAGQVVYLADTPLPSSNVPVCLAEHLTSPQSCTFTRGSLTAGATTTNQQPARHAAVVAAARRNGVLVVDPTGWFCSASSCPVIVQDTLLYRDATHMTQSYSRLLAPVLGRALVGVVPWAGG